jgi:D-3-phosphoglycerate dehydrogenase
LLWYNWFRMKHSFFLIIDFDSTLVKLESLDLLADIVLNSHKDRDQIVQRIKEITRLGMEGKINFGESLEQRVKLFSPRKKDIDSLVTILKENISDSVLRNINFFKNNCESIYIISGGFKEFIIPIAAQFGIESGHVLANNFIWDGEKSLGFDKINPLSQNWGKVKAVQNLKLKGEVVVIGDGFTDYEIRQKGAADKFIAFVENIVRENVVKNADFVAKDFNQVIKYLN